ncbi:conserved hypothetical protein [Alteracholeplasma palmae J233]|uniref:Uncharacterized protein n=1 Tax=Alteracholeplasma palmae (strain ATCC 49389 / J233) TaxID=1318466 RepID=U4KJZ6_ALTPJ|nr:type II toxin-antitoxin system HipA family toxin [Alteracholeplasma palmae]CCV63909.1 conserved hypothetical protein [Alteracholeplasma palmae J233]
MQLTIQKMEVYYNNQLVGYLEMIDEDTIAFQYDTDWIKKGFSISPFSLPLSDKVYISNSPYFKGLYAVFNDSLPDGWGEFLIRRMLLRKKINFEKLSPLVRLSLVNQTGLGGLEYLPKQKKDQINETTDLDLIAADINKELNNRTDGLSLDNLYKLGGASGGARPKVHLKINNEEWIIKFAAINESSLVGIEEYKANILAKECGINVSEFKLFDSKLTKGFFGTKRFDRIGDKKIHVIALSSILETTHQISNLDYIHLFQVIQKISVNPDDLYEAYRRMCFNVLYGNKDDHGKNHSFIYDEVKKGYVLSKAYDITNTIDKLEHEMTVNGSGNPTEKELIEVQERMQLSKEKCLSIIENIKRVINNITL